jgi:uncharacterized membrane protein YhaH (DUF805 family)
VLGELIYFLMLVVAFQYGGQVNTLPRPVPDILGLTSLALFFILQLSLLSRRLHDVGRDDLTFNFPFFNTSKSSGIFGLFVKREEKENKFGPPPKPSIRILALLGLD